MDKEPFVKLSEVSVMYSRKGISRVALLVLLTIQLIAQVPKNYPANYAKGSRSKELLYGSVSSSQSSNQVLAIADDERQLFVTEKASDREE